MYFQLFGEILPQGILFHSFFLTSSTEMRLVICYYCFRDALKDLEYVWQYLKFMLLQNTLLTNVLYTSPLGSKFKNIIVLFEPLNFQIVSDQISGSIKSYLKMHFFLKHLSTHLLS